jgi:2-methylcitrate dehydratase PrpD
VTPGPTAAQRLAAFAAGLQLDAVPSDVLAAARLHLLDTLGCGLAAHALGTAPYAAAGIDPTSRGTASAIGIPYGVAAPAAALANGIACHALDFDDTHGASIAHVSSVVVPAALAAAQARHRDGGELLAALVAGNEVTCSVGMPVGDAFHHRGFHPTAICGVFGATAAVARLARLSVEETAQALGIAGSMASGLLAYLTDGSDTKRIHPGWMAHAAHVAVDLAAAGAGGPAGVLEGHKGVYHAFVGLTDVEVRAGDLGVRWETPRIAFKPYPACHFLHAAIDAVDALVTRESLEPAAIERITVLMPRAGFDMVLAPLEHKRRPRTAYDAKFSAPFAIGALLARGRVDVTTFTEPMLDDEDVLAFAAIADHEVREYPTFPESFPAGVRLLLRDGRRLEEHVAHQRGGPHQPMDDAQVAAKFDDNAATALRGRRVDLLRTAVLALDDGQDLAPLQILQEARSRSPASR